jgi:hypothetical protein
MKDNVRALGKQGVTVRFLLESVLTEEENIKSLFIVAIPKNSESEPMVWGSGHLGDLSHATIVLQDLALKFLNGMIAEE